MTGEAGLIIATELTDDQTDFAWFEPMTRKAGQAAALIGEHRPASPDPGQQPASPDSSGPDDGGPDVGGPDSSAPDSSGQDSSGQDDGGGGIGLVLADAGYCSEDNLTSPG